MIRRRPRSTLSSSSAASDVYKRQDYDRTVISAGGGIVARSAKSVKLTPQVRAMLGVESAAMAPNELVRAILQAPVDLLWNGGIGTYVKSSRETAVPEQVDRRLQNRSNELVG